jgi:hypothetical protein
MARFARIGVGAGRTFDASLLSPTTRSALEAGMADAWAEYAVLHKQVDAGEVASGDVFGTREFLKNNYLYRMGGAARGIYGNAKLEAMYPVYGVDSDGERLHGAHSYRLRFAPGQLPPVNAFWSLTMYKLPASLLSANPLDRYLLNSSMLPQFVRDADGGLIQNQSPGQQWEPNWLPAPAEPFFMALRLYWPQAEALSGEWSAPPLVRVR